MRAGIWNNEVADSGPHLNMVGQSKPERKCERSSGKMTIFCKETRSQCGQKTRYFGWGLKMASCMPSEVRVKSSQSYVTTDHQSVSKSGFQGPSGSHDRILISVDIYSFTDVGRRFWLEVGSVICHSRVKLEVERRRIYVYGRGRVGITEQETAGKVKKRAKEEAVAKTAKEKSDYGRFERAASTSCKGAVCTAQTAWRTMSQEPMREASYVPSGRKREVSMTYLNRSHPPCSCCWDGAQSHSPPWWYCPYTYSLMLFPKLILCSATVDLSGCSRRRRQWCSWTLEAIERPVCPM
jgi:hypothetical protein